MNQALLFHYNPYFGRWTYWHQIPREKYWTYPSFARSGGERRDDFLIQIHLALKGGRDE